MKIILHGATSSSNFGDFLFADLFLRSAIKYNKKGDNIFFEASRFGIGTFFRSKLGYTRHQSIKDLWDADMLILFSGGYFGERTKTLREAIFRFIRYVPIGLWFVLRKKPVIISGVGGGPLSNRLLRKAMSKIMNEAQAVTVRDDETRRYFIEYGVTNDIVVTSDTAQVITPEMIPDLDPMVEADLKKQLNTKKIIFLHLYGKASVDDHILHKIISPLNSFLNKNPEYGVIIGCDWCSGIALEEHKISKALECDSVYYYDYKDAWQLCSLLQRAELIITPKLHVGIIGATLSKSVIAVPMHQEKTMRYYKQIGEADRCIPLSSVTESEMGVLIERFHNKKISLPESIIDLAKYNLDLVEKNIQRIKTKET